LFVKEWSHVQEDSYDKNNSKALGDHWSAKISRWWIMHSHEIWLERNNSIHGNDPTRNKQHEEEILEQVRHLYERKEDLPANARILLDLPIEMRIQQPVEILHTWLQNTEPMVTACINYAQEILIRTNRSILDFVITGRQDSNQNQNQATNTRLNTTHKDTTETIEFEQDSNRTDNTQNSENVDPNLPIPTVNQTSPHEEMKSRT
jgi:hypothetical protein